MGSSSAERDYRGIFVFGRDGACCDLQIRAGTVNCGTLGGAAGYVALCHFVFPQLHEHCSVGTGSGSSTAKALDRYPMPRHWRFDTNLLHCRGSGRAVAAAVASSLLPIAISLSLGAALLAILHFASIGNDERTALADLVLLTPVVFFFAKLLS